MVKETPYTTNDVDSLEDIKKKRRAIEVMKNYHDIKYYDAAMKDLDEKERRLKAGLGI